MEYTKLKNINEFVSETISPMKTPETVFEMYSVPIFETGHPEYLRGDEIASNKVLVRKNDVLLCKINPRINRVWVVTDESDYENIASSEWIVVRSSEYNPEFLAWYFRTPRFKRLMVSEVTGIGGSLTRAQPKAVAEYPVPVLPRAKQDDVVNTLNKVHVIIECRRKEIQKLDDLIKARFVEMFGTGDFHSVALKEITEVITKGTTPTTAGFDFVDDGVNFFKIESIMEDHTINHNKVAHVTEECHRSFKRSQLRTGDILFSIAGAIGRTAIITERDLPGNTNQALAIIRLLSDSGLSQRFLISSFESPLVTEQYNRKKRGIAQINLSLQDIGNLIIPVPDKNAQDEFERFVHQVDKSKAAVQAGLDKAQLLFDSLMQQYFG